MTPTLLLATAVWLSWDPWLFGVDECFAELSGMAIAFSIAAIANGGGGLGVRIVGALFFLGVGAAAIWFFGGPMLATERLDLVWIGLNGLALVWSGYTYFLIFSYYGLRKRNEEGAALPDDAEKLERMAGVDDQGGTMIRPSKGALVPLIVLGLALWLGSIVLSTLLAT